MPPFLTLSVSHGSYMTEGEHWTQRPAPQWAVGFFPPAGSGRSAGLQQRCPVSAPVFLSDGEMVMTPLSDWTHSVHFPAGSETSLFEIICHVWKCQNVHPEHIQCNRGRIPKTSKNWSRGEGRVPLAPRSIEQEGIAIQSQCLCGLARV